MEYNDEQILNVNDYELMAKAYASELKKRGFMVVQIDSQQNQELVKETFEKFLLVKSHLFILGGFLNTGKFYSLNERQLKKFSLLFDISLVPQEPKLPRDKTKCFLSFLSHEFLLIKNLIQLSQKSNFESEITNMLDARLSLLSQILQTKNP